MDAENRPRERRLAEVVRDMKIAEADRLDAADRDGESARARLELLADELSEVFDEAGGEEAGFDFRISGGSSPRLWVDAATHVDLARDGVTFMVLRDGRNGRMLLGETSDVDEAADTVTRYIATRSLERERLMDAPAMAAAAPVAGAAGRGVRRDGEPRQVVVRKPSRFARFIRSIIWFALGALVGAGALFVAYGERLGFENPVPAEYRGLYEPYVPLLPGDAAAVPGTADGADDAVEIETPQADGVEAAPDTVIVPVEDGTATVGGEASTDEPAGDEPADGAASDAQ